MLWPLWPSLSVWSSTARNKKIWNACCVLMAWPLWPSLKVCGAAQHKILCSTRLVCMKMWHCKAQCARSLQAVPCWPCYEFVSKIKQSNDNQLSLHQHDRKLTEITHTHAFTHTHTHTHSHTQSHTQSHTHTRTHTHTCTSAHTPARRHTYTHNHTHLHRQSHTCTCTGTYTSTHTLPNTQLTT